MFLRPSSVEKMPAGNTNRDIYWYCVEKRHMMTSAS